MIGKRRSKVKVQKSDDRMGHAASGARNFEKISENTSDSEPVHYYDKKYIKACESKDHKQAFSRKKSLHSSILSH